MSKDLLTSSDLYSEVIVMTRDDSYHNTPYLIIGLLIDGNRHFRNPAKVFFKHWSKLTPIRDLILKEDRGNAACRIYRLQTL